MSRLQKWLCWSLAAWVIGWLIWPTFRHWRAAPALDADILAKPVVLALPQGLPAVTRTLHRLERQLNRAQRRHRRWQVYLVTPANPAQPETWQVVAAGGEEDELDEFARFEAPWPAAVDLLRRQPTATEFTTGAYGAAVLEHHVVPVLPAQQVYLLLNSNPAPRSAWLPLRWLLALLMLAGAMRWIR